MMYTQSVIKTLDPTLEQPAYYEKAKIRQDIYQAAGDLESLIGTLSDTVHLLLVGFIDLVNQLHHATSLAEVRGASELLQQRFATISQKIDTKALQFPYQIKSIEGVIDEIIERAHNVTEVFKTQKTAQPEIVASVEE